VVSSCSGDLVRAWRYGVRSRSGIARYPVDRADAAMPGWHDTALNEA